MCQRRKTSSRRGARDGGFGNVDAAEVKIRVDSFLGSALVVSFRANAPPRAGPNRGSRPVRVAGVSATPDIAVSTHLFLPARERVVRSRRGALEPRPRGGVERVGAHFRGVVTPARQGSGSRRSWGCDPTRGAEHRVPSRCARREPIGLAVGNADARRRVRCARRAQTEIYNRVEGHETRAKRRLGVAGRPTTVSPRRRDPIRGVFFRFFQTGRTTRSTPAEARAFKKPTANSRSFPRGRCFL